MLGVLLIVLAYRIWRGVAENVDPDKNLMVRLVRKVYPVTGEFHDGKWFVKQDGRRYATPIFLCLAAIVFADIAFAIDSIPAAFAITRDPLLIWMGNVFALLGLRALFVLVESLIARFRYLDETIAVVLGLVGVKLLIEDLVKVGPVESLAVIAVAFTVGILLSIRADRRDPKAEENREERVETMQRGAAGLVHGAPAEQAGEPEQAGARHDVHGREQTRAEAASHRGDQHAHEEAEPESNRQRRHADTLRPWASWRSSAASRSSHCEPTSAIHSSASDIGAGVGR